MVWPVSFSYDASRPEVVRIECDGTAGLLGIELYPGSGQGPQLEAALLRREGETDHYYSAEAQPPAPLVGIPVTGVTRPVDVQSNEVLISDRQVRVRVAFVDHHGVEVVIRVDCQHPLHLSRYVPHAPAPGEEPARMQVDYFTEFAHLPARATEVVVSYGGRSVVKERPVSKWGGSAPSRVSVGRGHVAVALCAPGVPALTETDPGLMTDAHGYAHGVMREQSGVQTHLLFHPPLFQVEEIVSAVTHRVEISIDRDQVVAGTVTVSPHDEQTVAVEVDITDGWTTPSASPVERLRSTVSSLVQGSHSGLEGLSFHGRCGRSAETLDGQWDRDSHAVETNLKLFPW